MPALYTRSWTIATTLLAIVFFIAALSSTLYDLTSPRWITFHVVLRKTYSVIAFAAIAFAFRCALRGHGDRVRIALAIVGLGAYSGAIEVAQWLLGSTEGLGWNALDVACGAAGGVVAVADLILRGSIRARPRR